MVLHSDLLLLLEFSIHFHASSVPVDLYLLHTPSNDCVTVWSPPLLFLGITVVFVLSAVVLPVCFVCEKSRLVGRLAVTLALERQWAWFVLN